MKRSRGVVLLLLLLLLSLAACGGKSSQAGDEGTSDDEPNEPSFEGVHQQGAMTMNLMAPAMAAAGSDCPAPGVTSDLPSGAGPTAEQYRGKVLDGEGGAQVSCSVLGSSSFKVTGRIHAAGIAFEVADLTLVNGQGRGRISFRNAQLPSSISSASCEVLAVSTSSSRLQVQSGALWASFQCGELSAPGGTSCVGSGHFIFENCAEL